MAALKFPQIISKNFSTLLCASLLVANQTWADNSKGFYLGLGGASVENRLDGVDTSRLTFTELIGGYKYNNAAGVELRLGNGLRAATGSNYASADSPAVFSNIERDITAFQAIYYRAELVNEEARLYGLLGYSRLTSQLRVLDNLGKTTSSNDQSFSGISYGLGVGFIISDELNLNFEARSLCKSLDNKQNSLGINLDYRF